MTKDAIQIQLEFNDGIMDVSHLLMAGSLSIKEDFCNSNYGSTLNCATWRLVFDADAFFRLRDYKDKIIVRILDDNDAILFYGTMEPVLSGEWGTPDVAEPIRCEAVDFTELLDEKIGASLAYPAQVGGVPFWIYKRDNPSMSILYRLLELCGLEELIDDDAPDIEISIEQVSITEDEQTYREVIDALLGDFSYCITARADKITWGRIAYHEFDNSIEEMTDKEILGDNEKFRASKRYDVHNGVVVNYPKTKIMDDALLWRGSLPTGDTANPTPGEPIAAGDYWPEDSDIIDTWMDFESTYLDTAYLTGRERLRNDKLALLASSNQYIKDTRDPDIAIDGVVTYESLRAQLRYKNMGAAAAMLYWTEIYGKALVQTARPDVSYPKGASNPSPYASTFIFEDLHAQAAVESRYMMLSEGCWDITFASLVELAPGQVVRIKQPSSRWDGYALVISRARAYDFSGVWRYTLVSTNEVKALTTRTTATYRSGLPRPAQDGSTPRLIYIRAAAKPSTPVGASPAGWTTGMPEGTAPLWMSSGTFASTGDQVGSWTDPVRVSGIDKGAYRGYGTTDPPDAADGDFYIYTGVTTAERIQYHFYRYSAASGAWTETQDSASVMAGWKDALQLAKETGEVIFAAMLVVDILIANKLAVGGGTLTSGLLFRILDDDGNGNVVIEARYNGNKVWWIDVDTGRMYGNFAEIRNVLPYSISDSLDSSHPLEFEFYVPAETVKIAAIKLNAKGAKYRAYSTSSEFKSIWPAEVYTSSETPSHSLTFGTRNRSTDAGGAHSHGYKTPTGIKGAGRHSHTLKEGFWGLEAEPVSDHTHDLDSPWSDNATSGSGGSHNHTFDSPNGISGGAHQHTVTVNLNHNHGLNFGIYEGTLPTSVSIYCDNGAGYGSAISLGSAAILASDLNLKNYFSGPGWKKIKFTSATAGRIIANLILHVDITA